MRCSHLLSAVIVLCLRLGASVSGQSPEPPGLLRLAFDEPQAGTGRVTIPYSVTAAFDAADVQFFVSIPAGATASRPTELARIEAGSTIRGVLSVDLRGAGVGIHEIAIAVRGRATDYTQPIRRMDRKSLTVRLASDGVTEIGETEYAFIPPAQREWGERTAHLARRDFTQLGRLDPEPGHLQGAALGALLARFQETGPSRDSLADLAELERVLSGPAQDSTQPQRLPQAGAQGCLVNETYRTGVVRFQNENTGAWEGVANLYFEAWNAPHYHSSRTHGRAFRTDAYGNFAGCLPFDGNIQTYLDIYQDNGFVHVVRNDGPAPYDAFAWARATLLTSNTQIQIHVPYNEVGYILRTIYRSGTYAEQFFGARRGSLNAFYYSDTDDADGDYWCQGFNYPFGGCTREGEAIYLHQWGVQGENDLFEKVWDDYGEFVIAHEYGHAWEYALVADLTGDCGEEHVFTAPNSLGCAISEGFPDYYSWTTNRPFFGHWYDPEANHYGGARGPEIEAAVASYFYDLTDSPILPVFRAETYDDDMITISGADLVRSLRDGRVGSIPTQANSIQEVIAILDDVTPIPNKPEFANYSQPTTISVRVPRPAGLTTDRHQELWRRNIFGIQPPGGTFLVYASAPDYVTEKAWYPLEGSASHAAKDWKWYNGSSLWSSTQNSGFIAYAGSYTINWRLDARRVSDLANASGYATTVVCVQTTSCDDPPIAAPPRLVNTPDGVTDGWTSFHHFGSGVWLGGSVVGSYAAIQLYALSGAHQTVTRPANPLGRSRGSATDESADSTFPARADYSLLDRGPARVFDISVGYGPGVQNPLLAVVLDPDLGLSPLDDLLGWNPETNLVWVNDPELGYLGYLLPDGYMFVVRQYGDEVADPRGTTEVLAELTSRQSRVFTERGDVRFAIIAVAEGGNTIPQRLAVTLIRGQSFDDLLAAATQLRHAVEPSPFEATGPREFDFRQTLRSTTTPSTSLMAASGPPASRADPQAARRIVQREGIRTVAIGVPRESEIVIRIFDARGRLVRSLVEEVVATGWYEITWDGTDDQGRRLGPGVFTAVLNASSYRRSTYLVLVE